MELGIARAPHPAGNPGMLGLWRSRNGRAVKILECQCSRKAGLSNSGILGISGSGIAGIPGSGIAGMSWLGMPGSQNPGNPQVSGLLVPLQRLHDERGRRALPRLRGRAGSEQFPHGHQGRIQRLRGQRRARAQRRQVRVLVEGILGKGIL